MLTTRQRVWIITSFDEEVRKLRRVRWGIVSIETANKVLAACLQECHLVVASRGEEDQPRFLRRVKDRLQYESDPQGVPYGIDPLTIWLIIQIIVLFIRLYLALTSQGIEEDSAGGEA